MLTVSYHDPVHGQKYPAIFRCIVRVPVSYHDPVHGQKYLAIIRCMVKSILLFSGAL